MCRFTPGDAMTLEQRTATDVFPSAAPAPRKRTSKMLVAGLLFISAAAMVALARVGFWLWAVFHVPDSPTIRAELEKIRSAGHPVTTEELRTWYVPPSEEESAMPVLRQFMGDLGPWYDEKWSQFGFYGIPSPGETWDAELLSRVETASHENQAALSELRNQRPFKGKRYPRALTLDDLQLDLERPFELSISSRAPDAIMTLLAVDALNRARSGDGDGAMLSLISYVDVMRLVRDEQFLFAAGVSQDFSLFRSALNFSLTETRPGEQSLQELMNTLIDADDPAPFIERAVVDRSNGLRNFAPTLPFIFDPLIELEPEMNYYTDDYRSARMWEVKGKTADMELYLLQYGRGIEAMMRADSGQDSVPAAKDSAALKRTEFHSESLIVSTNLGHQIAGDVGEYATFASQLRTAVIALGAERLERRHRRYPESLEAIQEAFSIETLDLTSGRTISYASNGDAYFVGAARRNRLE